MNINFYFTVRIKALVPNGREGTKTQYRYGREGTKTNKGNQKRVLLAYEELEMRETKGVWTFY